MGIYFILELIIISTLVFSIILGSILNVPFEGGLFFIYLMSLVFVGFIVLPAFIFLKLKDTHFPQKPSSKKEPNLFIEAILPIYNPKNKGLKTILLAQLIMWGTYIYASRELADIYSEYGALAGFLAVSGVIFLIRIRIAYEHERVNYKQFFKETLVNILLFIVIYFILQLFFPIYFYQLFGI